MSDRPSDGMALDELRDEFDWIIEFQGRMAERICGDADVHNLVDYVSKLEVDNAKLREVCRRYMRRIVPELCEQNAELHRENATLRTQLADVTESVGRIEERCARLRELCKRFSDYVSHDRCEGCVYKSRCNDGLIDECWQLTEIRKLASELGVVVDC